ncbi:hypothetical protein JOF34_001084 [Microbacterium amylolyticum]|uniref:Uncharacterized protein n=1 Tax=Microbacterium amylolyticum TaxID=936337 RepID=A0ABS4ZGT3_9MICO|nr:hypothetical protein [Microbacterium amylolyticum]
MRATTYSAYSTDVFVREPLLPHPGALVAVRRARPDVVT